jgi:cell division protein FtsI (penicillin-binding protein 3)
MPDDVSPAGKANERLSRSMRHSLKTGFFSLRKAQRVRNYAVLVTIIVATGISSTIVCSKRSTLQSDKVHHPADSDQLVSSINPWVQDALSVELKRGMLQADAEGAEGIVLDVNSGEVVAMAAVQKLFLTSENEIGKGTIAKIYEPGSTFKPITMAAAIDIGILNDLSTRWDAKPIKAGNFVIQDSLSRSNLNAPQALLYSSNTVTARLADKIGAERMRTKLLELEMHRELFPEDDNSAKPIFPRKENGFRLTNLTVGYGHGIAVSQVHIASAYAALVNGGIWRPATLVNAESGQIPHGRRVFKESTSAQMRELLRMMTLHGTGRRADAIGYRVGGSTGSVERVIDGKYDPSSLVTSFAAAFPMERPRYVVVVVLNGAKATSAFTAAPIVGQLIPKIAPKLGVASDKSDGNVSTEIGHMIRR